MGLGGLQKQTALRLIEGLEIELRGADVSVRFLTVVPFFKARAPGHGNARGGHRRKSAMTASLSGAWLSLPCSAEHNGTPSFLCSIFFRIHAAEQGVHGWLCAAAWRSHLQMVSVMHIG